MSGAEAALLGVGILCNAMQIITFAKDVIHVYRNIHDGRAPDPNLDLYLKNAKASFYEMNQTTAQMGPLSKEQQKIVDVGNKVHDCVDELQQQFAKLHVDERLKKGLRGKIAAFKKSALALWREKELQDAEENLHRYEQLLHGLLLDRVCSQSQAAEIASLESYQHLQVSLQTIISELEHDSTNVADLFACIGNRVADEHATTRAVVEDRAKSAENKICQSMSQTIDQLRRELLDREQDKGFEKQYEQLLSSLSFPEMNSRKNKISNEYPGTFNWIFDPHAWWQSDGDSSSESGLTDMTSQLSEHYQDCEAKSTDDPRFDNFAYWLESDSNVFWVSGKPASGKSLLMKFLAFSRSTVEHLKVWCSDFQVLTHFFWNPGQKLQRNVEGMVLSLLYQVLDGRPGLCRRLCEAQSSVRHKRSYSDWSLEELSAALLWVLESSSSAFCIFIDGLDEAEELQHLPWPEWTSAEVIHKLLKVDKIKLCASSREENAFCSFFSGQSRLRIHQLNDCDITLFVKARLDICVLGRFGRDHLSHEIVKKAEGVFLWAALVVDSLNRAIRQGNVSIEMLQERIQQTPSELSTLYTDMWGRIGDDVYLRSIRRTASLYFNLAIAAREVKDYLPYMNPFSHPDTDAARMSSLVVMAAAAQDKPMADILSAGRIITTEELRARCSRAEGDLQWACRGLLEVTRTNDTSDYVCGDRRLLEYNFTKVDFIHRTAFDFLMDTVLGRECLEFCGASKSQQVSRLFAAHLIRARFIYLRDRHHIDLMDIRLLSCRQNINYDGYLEMAIAMSCDDRISREDSVRDGLINALKAWQSSGLFSGGKYCTPLTYAPSTLNSLEHSMIEAVTSVMLLERGNEHSIVGLRRLLEGYPESTFLNAIPAILRAMSLGCRRNTTFKHGCEILQYILHHLQYIAKRKRRYWVAVRRAILALHCWYISNCLANLAMFYNPVVFYASTELSDYFYEEDWQHILLLQFRTFLSHKKRADSLFKTHTHYALIAVNLVAAHQLMNAELQKHSPSISPVYVPKDISSRFDAVLVADVYEESPDKSMSTMNFYAPDRCLHSQIRHLVQMGLSGNAMLEHGNTWQEILKCSADELSPINASRAYNYVVDEFKDAGLDFSTPILFNIG
ncbi:related to small s protein [Fusarium fujikuroi IMI 58289]|uniref:Related to small s protein n=1 Tax=Gibberella fujikuroi (strain CBS 195.34 / IMI 58289 / NRRL A-6831) TaxID=1279085 RepID=S0DZU2_GIBF5|nr:related to small s protein [Fusarium fujikuroi IMI 58289]KLP16684.1 small s protein [Fusarium fujikuroi]CCT68031.1 related to small s protein [Fusarium fujikuroi IMI 58289]SCN93912.1 related to small s protein [Fusarium fujikuroi]